MKRWLNGAAAAAALLHATSAMAQPAPLPPPTVNAATTITTGNTFQQILPAVAPTARRQSLTIQNNNTSDSCWIYIGAGTPTEGKSIILDTTHGTSYTRFYPYVPADAIQATCASSSDTIYVDTQ
jgi:hypothetical protein